MYSSLGTTSSADFYLLEVRRHAEQPQAVIRNAPYQFGPVLLDDDRILAITDREAPNLKIVEVRRRQWSRRRNSSTLFPTGDSRIQNWVPKRTEIFVSYIRRLQTVIDIFDLSGDESDRCQSRPVSTARLLGGSDDGQELFFEQESFTKPTEICICRTRPTQR